MPWVKFIKKYDEKLGRGLKARSAGTVRLVKDETARHAIAIGAAEPAERPKDDGHAKRGNTYRSGRA